MMPGHSAAGTEREREPSVLVVLPGITVYSDLVVFRLHDQRGKPTVKLYTHEDGPRVKKGSGLGLLGDSDNTQAFIGTEGPVAKMGLKNGDGKREGMEP